LIEFRVQAHTACSGHTLTSSNHLCALLSVAAFLTGTYGVDKKLHKMAVGLGLGPTGQHRQETFFVSGLLTPSARFPLRLYREPDRDCCAPKKWPCAVKIGVFSRDEMT
jgi:hypothetical protein